MKKLKDFYNRLSGNTQIAIKATIIGLIFMIGCVGMYFLAGGFK